MFRIVPRESRRAFTIARKVTAHERDRSAVHRDVGARARGNADLRLRERWRIVDPLSYHRDESYLCLQPLHDLDLLLGPNVRDHLVNAELAVRAARGGVGRVAAGDGRTRRARA